MSFKDNPIIFLAGATWKYSKGNRHKVVLYLFLFLIANAVMFLDPLILAKLLNIIQEEGVTKQNIVFLILLAAALPFLRLAFWIFHGPARVIERNNAFIVRANYKQYLVKGIIDLPLQWQNEHHSGDIIDKVDKASNSLSAYAGKTFIIIESVINLVTSYIALTYFNLHAAYIVLVAFVIMIMMILRFDARLKKEYRTLFKMDNKVAEKVYDTISNITTVIILRLEKLLIKDIVKKIMRPFGLYRKNAKDNEVKWFALNMCTSSLFFIIIASYVLENYLKGIPILVGTISALAAYTKRIGDVVYRFAGEYGEIVRQKAAVENMEEIVKEFREKEKSRTLNLERDWKELTIKRLTFSYHGKEGGDLHLNNISLTMRKNEKIALVGESGSGKTTFLKLMRNLFNPRNVDVYLDNKEVVGKFAAISENIALIPQEPEIFSTTIRENITVGIEHKEDYIKKFTDMAEFTQVVERLPKKLDSSIFEKGVNLSGGEKQRLALARGLMAAADKPIVFFDEPTSSVDAKNEMKIYDHVFQSFKNKTIISTIHRLHLLHRFDKILVFNKGNIVATGTVNELLKKSQEFKTLWKKYHRSMHTAT